MQLFYIGHGIFGKDKAIKEVIKKYKFTANELIYIGDETRDIEAAKKSKVKVIAVGWGFNSPEVLIAHQPDFFVETPRELVEAIIT